jgi:hypothetical protein
MPAGSQIYVSVAIPDRPVAERIVALLQTEEGYDVHWEETELGALSASAEAAAANARCVLVVWSYSSASSRWVWQEAAEAAARNALVQIEIDPVDRPVDGPCIAFGEWNGSTRDPQWRQLMEALRAAVGLPQGQLPLKAQAAPAVASGLLALCGALAMTAGAEPTSPDLVALLGSSGSPAPTGVWAAGGSDDLSLTALAPARNAIALVAPLDAVPLSMEPLQLETLQVSRLTALQPLRTPAFAIESITYQASFQAADTPEDDG